MSETETKGRLYATQVLLREGVEFAPGDELGWHVDPTMQQKLLELGRASYDRPSGVTAVYALARLSYHPHTAGITLEPGDRIDGVLPAPIVAGCIANGQATLDEPKVKVIR
jgi:hypothetical protein